jgi:predicted glycosyltransferase involved in capsule biosynthesis
MNKKILITTKFWTDGVENSTRLRNVMFCYPKMIELTDYLKSNGVDCEFKIYDFSPERIIDVAEHRPYKLSEYKKAEKTNLIINENSNFNYIFMFDSDEFFDEKDYTNILNILNNLGDRKIYTFDAAKLEQDTVNKLKNNETVNFFEEQYSFAYSGKKENGPLFAGIVGGLGGVFICDLDLLRENGGFDQSFVGWGGEDGDMLSRIMYSGKEYQLLPQRDFFPFHLPHFSDWSNEKYSKRFL